MKRFTIDVSGNTQVLDQLRARLRAPRTELHGVIGEYAAKTYQAHIRKAAATRHRTSGALGAQATGALEKAAQEVESRATPAAAEIVLRPGHLFARAFGDVEILPGPGKKALTIPAHRMAYGRRAREIDGLVMMRVGPKRTPVLARPVEGGGMETYYLLVARVRQKQDRQLLPSDDEVYNAAEVGAREFLLGKASKSNGGGSIV